MIVCTTITVLFMLTAFESILMGLIYVLVDRGEYTLPTGAIIP